MGESQDKLWQHAKAVAGELEANGSPSVDSEGPRLITGTARDIGVVMRQRLIEVAEDLGLTKRGE